MEQLATYSMKRRCFCHDYRDRGIYMITLEVVNCRPILSKLAGDICGPGAASLNYAGLVPLE